MALTAPNRTPRPSVPPAASAPADRSGWAGRFGPNWYAAVMGTAIVANGAHALPKQVQSAALSAAAAGVWVLSLLLLVALAAVRLAARRLPDRIRALDHPATAVFLGCPPMAMLAVAAGTLYGIGVAGRVLYLLIARYRVDRAGSAPTWLLPVVAPMVSAALGPALIPHLPAGQARESMLAVCVALFGASLLAVLTLLPGIWSRLVHEEPLPALLVPTLFLVLGPLGQSVTAVTQFATVQPGLRGFALVYGVAVIGFAMLWLGIAGSASVQALRGGMPFAMTWWAYTFPVGTCVTGAAGLARLTGLELFAVLAVALFALLLTAWAVVGVRTVRGLASGVLIAR